MKFQSGSDLLVALSTVETMEQGRVLAAALLQEKAAACVSLLPGVESHYQWQGKLEQSGEVMLVMKIPHVRLDLFREVFEREHPYDCAELLLLEVDQVRAAYLQWALVSCGALSEGDA